MVNGRHIIHQLATASLYNYNLMTVTFLKMTLVISPQESKQFFSIMGCLLSAETPSELNAHFQSDKGTI